MEDLDLSKLEAIEQRGTYRYYRPLTDAVNEWTAWAKTPELRVYTGIPEFDHVMRGTAPSEQTIIEGFTHSGKTLFATEVLRNNAHHPFLVFTPDETRAMMLIKLATADQGVGAWELERRIQEDDTSARELLLNTAAKYAKLAIFEESVTIQEMDSILDETTHALGEKPKAFMFDYADLLVGFDDVRGAIVALKQWGKRRGLPGFILHQASRTSGSGGRKMAIDSGAYGGEQQATHVIGVRRKKYQHLAALNELEVKIANSTNQKSIQEYEAKQRELRGLMIEDEDTITVSLVKNKRPPSTLVDDMDFKIDTATGRMFSKRSSVNNGGVVRVNKSSLHTLRKETGSWEEREFVYGDD